MDFIEENPTVGQHLTSNSRLQHTIISQRGVMPTYKSIVAIPGTLTMAQEAKIVCSFLVDSCKFSLLFLVFGLINYGRSVYASKGTT